MSLLQDMRSGGGGSASHPPRLPPPCCRTCGLRIQRSTYAGSHIHAPIPYLATCCAILLWLPCVRLQLPWPLWAPMLASISATAASASTTNPAHGRAAKYAQCSGRHSHSMPVLQVQPGSQGNNPARKFCILVLRLLQWKGWPNESQYALASGLERPVRTCHKLGHVALEHRPAAKVQGAARADRYARWQRIASR